MKSSIFNRINQYLLERYPNIWNTKLVWMLLISLIIHILFYIGGYLTFTNPESLQDYLNDSSVTANNGTMLFSIGVSIIIIVLWIVYLLKNNAFKNFYPTSSKKIFFSFLYLLIIFFASTTFHLSYVIGYKTYINKTYPKANLQEDILNASKAEPFLLMDIGEYTLDRRTYPSPFDTLDRNYKENKSDLFDGPATYSFGNWHQFYSTYTIKTLKEKPETQGLIDKSIRYIDGDNDTVIITMLDKVIDVSSISDTGLSIYNYSGNFFFDENYSRDLESSYPNENLSKVKNTRQGLLVRAHTYDMLKRKDSKSIKSTLQNFIKLTDKYKIRTNLTIQNWENIINSNTSYRVDSFIKKYDVYTENGNYDNPVELTSYYADSTTSNDVIKSPSEKMFEIYVKTRTTNKYIDASSLKTCFENIQDLSDWSLVYDIFLVSIWVAFGLSTILFIFRITSLKSVIFTGVASGLIGILIGLFGLSNSNHSGTGLIIMYFVFVLYMIIFFGPIVLKSQINKKVKAVTMNLTLLYIVPFVILIISIISTHQENHYEAKYGYLYDREKHLTIVEQIGFQMLNWYLFIFGILFVLFYTIKIKKWKALPEG